MNNRHTPPVEPNIPEIKWKTETSRLQPMLDLAVEDYRQARMDGHSSVCPNLECKLEAGISKPSELEQEIREELAKDPIRIAPLHKSGLSHSACQDGMLRALFELYWEKPDEPRLNRQVNELKCSDTKTRANITAEIVKTVMRGLDLALTEGSKRHVQCCPCCHSHFSVWLAAARLCREDESYDEIILAAENRDPAIEQKTVREGVALFRPSDDSNGGLVLIVDPEDWMEIRGIKSTVSRQEFRAMV